MEDVLILLVAHARARLQLERVDLHAGIVVHLAKRLVFVHGDGQAPFLQIFGAGFLPSLLRGLLLRSQRRTAAAARTSRASALSAASTAATGRRGRSGVDFRGRTHQLNPADARI